MTEPEFSYKKKSREPEEPLREPVTPSLQPSPPPPVGHPSPGKFTCPTCHRVFSTNEELTMHMETVHQSPKKKM